MEACQRRVKVLYENKAEISLTSRWGPGRGVRAPCKATESDAELFPEMPLVSRYICLTTQ